MQVLGRYFRAKLLSLRRQYRKAATYNRASPRACISWVRVGTMLVVKQLAAARPAALVCNGDRSLRGRVRMSATASAHKAQPFALHFGSTSVAVPADADFVQGLNGAITQSLSVLKEKAGSKPKRWEDVSWRG